MYVCVCVGVVAGVRACVRVCRDAQKKSIKKKVCVRVRGDAQTKTHRQKVYLNLVVLDHTEHLAYSKP